MLHPTDLDWTPLDSLHRLGLALTLGLFVGLEREWRGKEAGLRTFSFASILGCIGGMIGPEYSLMSNALVGVLIIFLNIHTLRTSGGLELTTSAALLVTGASGVLCGEGRIITPAAVAVLSAGLLAWKERLALFSHNLTAQELRGAILLSILTFVIYPLLPTQPVDPWGLVSPQAAWATVILIAAIGFVNYLLWKIFGRNGIELTGFLGGLVNSTVAVNEIATRLREMGPSVEEISYCGVLLATAAMACRNAVLLAFLAPPVFAHTLLPLVLILSSSAGLVRLSHFRSRRKEREASPPPLPLDSPFSLFSALKFGMIFFVLQIIANLAQGVLGQAGFYAISIVGGLVSSASAVASAAALMSAGKISPATGAIGAILASLASALINVGLVARYGRSPSVSRRLFGAWCLSAVLGVGGAALHTAFWSK